MHLLWDSIPQGGWTVVELSSLGVVSVLALLCWAVVRIQDGRRRGIFGSASFLLGVALLLEWAALSGFAETMREYPLIAFSEQKSLLGADPSVALLLGSDDQYYGLLVVVQTKAAEDPNRAVLYLPKKDLKWMAVVGYLPLYRLAHVYDYLSRRAPRSLWKPIDP